MIKFAIGFFIVTSLLAPFTAEALTIPSGSVIVTDTAGDQTVVPVEESETTAQIVENQGYAVVGGHVVVPGADGLVAITVDEALAIIKNGGLAGSDLSPEAVEAIEGLNDDDLAAVTEALVKGDITADDIEAGVEACGHLANDEICDYDLDLGQ